MDQLEKYGFIFALKDFETLNLEQNICPVCFTGDSNRLYAIYFRRIFPLLVIKKKYRLVDFAPVPVLADLIKSFSIIDYRSADLYMPNVDDRVDISDMKIYKTNSVDIFLCSHVLEHVKKDFSALKELYRILDPKGFGILMVPIMLSLKDNLEDRRINSENLRWKFYGQHDHVRMYSKDGFINRIKAVGFKLNELGVEYFGNEVFKKHGIAEKSILYVVSKQ